MNSAAASRNSNPSRAPHQPPERLLRPRVAARHLGHLPLDSLYSLDRALLLPLQLGCLVLARLDVARQLRHQLRLGRQEVAAGRQRAGKGNTLWGASLVSILVLRSTV